jgi:hypothetical protein
MTSTLWIAVGATVLMIAAHIVLFWWFLARPEKKEPDPGCTTKPGHEKAPGD